MSSPLLPDEHLLTWFSPETFVPLPERFWLSTKGSVSALQCERRTAVLCDNRPKRVILFPLGALAVISAYPLEHPLNQRARVDLTENACYANREFFSAFWFSKYAAEVGELLLQPRDASISHPGWAHYTGSLDYSMSRTFLVSPKS